MRQEWRAHLAKWGIQGRLVPLVQLVLKGRKVIQDLPALREQFRTQQLQSVSCALFAKLAPARQPVTRTRCW